MTPLARQAPRAGLLQFEPTDVAAFPTSSQVARPFAVTAERTGTANGGSEWHLCVGGARVLWNDSGVGIFTEPHVTAEQVFPELLAKAQESFIRRAIERMLRVDPE